MPKQLSPGDRIERLRQLYDAEDHNPVFAWQAYEEARAARLNIPEWVLRYFDLAAANLGLIRALERPHKRAIASSVVRAFGFSPGGVEITLTRALSPETVDLFPTKRPGRFNPLRADDTKRFYAESVDVCLQRGQTVRQAKQTVARAHKVSVKTIERAIEQYPLRHEVTHFPSRK